MSVIPGQTVSQLAGGAEVQAEAVTHRQEVDSGRTPEPQRSSGIRWAEVLGGKPLSPQDLIDRQERPTPVEVSPRVIEIAKENVLRAIGIAIAADQSGTISIEKNPNFLPFQIREIIKATNPNVDFTQLDSTTVAVDNFFKTHPSQAVLLGFAFQEEMMRILQSRYQFEIEKPPSQQQSPQKEDVIVIPKIVKKENGQFEVTTEVLTYEQWSKMEEGQEEKKYLFGLFTKRVSKSREEFIKMALSFQQEIGVSEGSPFPARITPRGQAGSLNDADEFILEQLKIPINISDVASAKKLFEEINRGVLIRSEIIQATGGDASKVEDIFGDMSRFLREERVNDVIEQLRREQATKTKEELNAAAEQAYTAILEERRQFIEELIRERESKDKKTPEDSGDELSESDISKGVEDQLGVLGLSDYGVDKLKQLVGLEKGESLAKLRLERDKVARRLEAIKNSEGYILYQRQLQEAQARLNSLVTQRDKLQSSLERTSQQNVNIINSQIQQLNREISDLTTQIIPEYESQIKTYLSGNEGIDSLTKTLNHLDEQIYEAEFVLKQKIFIGDQEKTVEEWLNEIRRIRALRVETSETTKTRNKVEEPLWKSKLRKIKDVKVLRQELAKVEVLQRYFSESNLEKRSIERLRELGQSLIAPEMDRLEILNPTLHTLLSELTPGQQGQPGSQEIVFSFIRYIFGNEVIYPTNPDAPEVQQLNTFLDFIKGRLPNIKSPEDLDKLFKEVRDEILGGKKDGRKKGPSPSAPSSGGNGPGEGGSSVGSGSPRESLAEAESTIPIPEAEQRPTITAKGHSEKGSRGRDEDAYFDGEFHFGEDIPNLTQILKDVGILAGDEDLESLIEALKNKGISVSIVADGMGGHENGEIASALATVGLIREVSQLEGEISEDSLKQLIKNINDYIRVFNETKTTNKDQGKNAGTTLAAQITDRNGNTWAVAVGDSRIYKIDPQNNLELITADQSRAWSLMEVGYLSPSEILTSKVRSIITGTLDGSKKNFNIQIYNLGQLTPGTRLVLVCDGVWDGINTDQIPQDLLTQFNNKVIELTNQGKSQEEAREIAAKEFFAQLFKQFNLQGDLDNLDPARIASNETAQLSKDNATVVVVKY